MTFWSSIVEKTSTFHNEIIYIMFKCTMHLHSHWNKMVFIMNPSIFEDFSNDIKFHNCTCCSIKDIRSHCFLCQFYNYHIGNKNLVLTSHVNIGL
jgi:hypothetical protein